MIRDLGDLVVKALVWNIWLVRNGRIFNATEVLTFLHILKINRIILSWF